jgi:hypothetical protein
MFRRGILQLVRPSTIYLCIEGLWMRDCSVQHNGMAFALRTINSSAPNHRHVPETLIFPFVLYIPTRVIHSLFHSLDLFSLLFLIPKPVPPYSC